MTWCCDACRSRIAREVAMDAKTPTIAATATAMSSHMVRGERLPFDCSVMNVRSKAPEYQGLLYAATFALDNRAPAALLDSCRGYPDQSRHFSMRFVTNVARPISARISAAAIAM